MANVSNVVTTIQQYSKMDLVEILIGKIDKDDEMPVERRIELARGLSALDEVQAKSAYKLISTYKSKYDNERRVGDTENDAPYYAKEVEEPHQGMHFHLDMLPNELLLILEQFVMSA